MNWQPSNADTRSSLCPDCDAARRLVEIAPGIRILQILHDATCPWLAHQEREP